MSEKIQHEVVEHWWRLGGLGKSLPFFQPISPLSTNTGSMQAVEHLLPRDCRHLGERAVVRLPDSQRSYRFGEDRRIAWPCSFIQFN